MKIQNNKTIKLNTKREKAIDEYISMQEDFKTLNAKAIVTMFKINGLETVVDIENCNEEQEKLIDELKEEEKILASGKVPTKEEERLLFIVLPFHIVNMRTKQDTCLDELETKDIDLINKRTKIKLDTYSKYLTKEETK